jgi:hypothetical protein
MEWGMAVLDVVGLTVGTDRRVEATSACGIETELGWGHSEGGLAQFEKGRKFGLGSRAELE